MLAGLKKYKKYISKAKGQSAPSSLSDDKPIIGPELNFAASEAYKMLRTNLMLSLAGNRECQIIGITSAIKSEGKSTTALNTAYTIAENKKRVLLIEADMRLPTLSKRVDCERTPGLSNVLVDQYDIRQVIQKTDLHDNLYLLTAGDIPPNPSELLDSDKMRFILDECRQAFDTIIIDLTPVTIVADATIVGKLCDGVVVVVAEGYCSKKILKEAINQLNMANVKILGFVMTKSGASNKKYYYKKYYKGYYRNYYKKRGYYEYGYGSGYGRSAYASSRAKASTQNASRNEDK